MGNELIRHDWTKEDYREYRKRIVRESQRRRRAKAREKGLCTMCARFPAEQDRMTCNYCYNRVVKWNSVHKRRKVMTYGDALKMLVKIKNDPRFPAELVDDMERAIETFEEEWGNNKREEKENE